MTEPRRRILLATDFDGTVASVVPPTANTQWHPLARSVLERLAQHDEVTLAIVSGRALQELYNYTGGLRCYRAGSFGAEIDTPAGLVLERSIAPEVTIPHALTVAFARDGVAIDRKPHSFSLHWRNAGMSRAHPVLARFTEWAAQNEFEIFDCRGVLEAVRTGVDKVTALRRIANHVRPATVIFAGDDIPDIAAVAWAASRGFGFFIISAEVPNAPSGCVAVSSSSELWMRIRETVVSLLSAPLKDQPCR
jgi:trehalose 6-phosphate phosphatase